MLDTHLRQESRFHPMYLEQGIRAWEEDGDFIWGGQIVAVSTAYAPGKSQAGGPCFLFPLSRASESLSHAPEMPTCVCPDPAISKCHM